MVPSESVALVKPATRRIPRPGASLPPLRGYNPVDIVALIYLGITSLLLLAHPGRLPWYYLAIHLALTAGVALLRLIPHLGRFPLQFLRESYPLWMLPLAYSELDMLNRLAASRYYDDVVLAWDRAIFGLHPHLLLSQWIPIPAVSEVLHASYLIYALLTPILGLTLYFQGRPEAFRVFATTVGLCMYGAYLVFIFFPVQGPWYGTSDATQGFFSGIVDQYLTRGSARGTAFPSSHVAGAVVVAAMARWFSRRLSWFMIGLAASISIATVYGGFHYAIDAVAGLGWGLAIAALGPRVHAGLLRQHRLPHIRLRFPHLRIRSGQLRVVPDSLPAPTPAPTPAAGDTREGPDEAGSPGGADHRQRAQHPGGVG